MVPAALNQGLGKGFLTPLALPTLARGLNNSLAPWLSMFKLAGGQDSKVSMVSFQHILNCATAVTPTHLLLVGCIKKDSPFL